MQALEKVGKIICGGMLIAIILALLTATVGSFIFSNIKYVSQIIVPVALISFVVLFKLIKGLIERHTAFIEKHYALIACSMIALVLIACIGFGYVLRLSPDYDFGQVYEAAVNLAETGLIYPSEESLNDPNYFYYFPHNLGAVSVLAAVFKGVKLFGGDCYFIAGMVFNALLFAGSLACIAGSLKRVLGKSNAIIGLSMVMLCPLTYFVAPIFYTDGLMMLFPVLIVYLYIRCIQAERLGIKVCFCGLMALSAALGTMIKVTSLIPLIAVCAYQIISCAVMRSDTKKELPNNAVSLSGEKGKPHINAVSLNGEKEKLPNNAVSLNEEKKKTYINAVSLSDAKKRLTNTAVILLSAVLAVLMLFGMNRINTGFYAKQMDSSRLKEYEIPKLHWVMMGFSEYGRYNGDDYDYTRSYPAGEERETAIKERIADRIRTKGFLGMIELFAYKTTVLLGNGTLNIPDYMEFAVNDDTILYEMTAGTGKIVFSSIARGYNLAMLLTIMYAYGVALIGLFGNKDSKSTSKRRRITPLMYCFKDNLESALLFVPIITLAGVILFFLFWEISERYIMGFMPLIMLMTATALCTLKRKERVFKAQYTSNDETSVKLNCH